MPAPRLDPYVVIEGIVRGNQFGLATLHDRQQAVLIIRIGRVGGSPFSHPPVLPFFAGEQIARVGESRHPSAVEKPRVPADMISMQMRAKHIVDVVGRNTSGGEIREIRPVLPVIAQLVRALLVISRTGVDQDGRLRGLYDCAVKRENH